MNYVATALYIYVGKAEDLTFNLLISLIGNKGLKPLWVNGVPEYHLQNFVFQELIKENVPEVYYHFRRL